MEEIKKNSSKSKSKYFDVEEEIAVKKFLTADTQEERSQIYNDSLKHPIEKMVSSIIRRYKLYRKDMDFDQLHTDTCSFLITKVDKFQPAKGKKAYSYFGTICKNYLMGQIQKDNKHTNRTLSYEDISTTLEEDDRFIYHIDEDNSYSSFVIEEFLELVRNFIDKESLNENEQKLGYALIDIFENYEKIFLESDNKKFNKNMILLTIREMTNLSTKEIRSSIKRFKKLYKVSVDSFFEL